MSPGQVHDKHGFCVSGSHPPLIDVGPPAPPSPAPGPPDTDKKPKKPEPKPKDACELAKEDLAKAENNAMLHPLITGLAAVNGCLTGAVIGGALLIETGPGIVVGAGGGCVGGAGAGTTLNFIPAVGEAVLAYAADLALISGPEVEDAKKKVDAACKK